MPAKLGQHRPGLNPRSARHLPETDRSTDLSFQTPSCAVKLGMMYDIFWIIIFYGSLVFALVALILPLWAMWRAALAGVLLHVYLWLFSGIAQDDSLGLVFLTLFLLQVWAAVALIFALRIGIAAWRRKLTWARLKGPGWVWPEAALCDLGGLLLGTLAMPVLAFAFAGTALGPWLDIGVAIGGLGAGLALTVLAFRRRSLRPVLPAATVAVIGLWGVFSATQPARIMAEAERLADGRPFCFSHPSIPLHPRGLTLFTAPQADGYARRHFHLVIEAERGFETSYWSYRRQNFFSEFASTRALFEGVAACHPVPDPMAVPATPDVLNVARGEDRFSVPMSLHPRLHNISAGLTVQSDITAGPVAVIPVVEHQVSIGWTSGAIRLTDDDLPLADLPAPDELDMEALESGGLRLRFAGTDPDTGYQVSISCLEPVFANRLCSVYVRTGYAGYGFDLPVTRVQEWPQAAADVIALFDSFRVSP